MFIVKRKAAAINALLRPGHMIPFNVSKPGNKKALDEIRDIWIDQVQFILYVYTHCKFLRLKQMYFYSQVDVLLEH